MDRETRRAIERLDRELDRVWQAIGAKPDDGHVNWRGAGFTALVSVVVAVAPTVLVYFLTGGPGP